MRKITRCGGLFLGSALLALALLAPQTARSATRTIAGAGCLYNSGINSYQCSMPTDDTTFTVSNLDWAWFHFICPGAGSTVPVALFKTRNTGAVFSDTQFHTCAGSGTEAHQVVATNVKTGAAGTDYLYGICYFPSSFHGFQATF
jgi:hypothetical protein